MPTVVFCTQMQIRFSGAGRKPSWMHSVLNPVTTQSTVCPHSFFVAVFACRNQPSISPSSDTLQLSNEVVYYFIFTSTGQKNVERMIMMTLGQHAGLLIHWTNSTPDLVCTLASDWSHSAESSGDKRHQQMRFEIWHTDSGNKILAWGLSRHVWAKYSYRHDAAQY